MGHNQRYLLSCLIFPRSSLNHCPNYCSSPLVVPYSDLQLWNGFLSYQLVTTAITKSVRLSWSNDLQTCHLPSSAIAAVDNLSCPEALLARSKYSQSTTTTTTTTTTTSEASSSSLVFSLEVNNFHSGFFQVRQEYGLKLSCLLF